MHSTIIERSGFMEAGIGALLEIPEPPERLWMRGTLPSKETKRLAVVGSRALTEYGERACESLIAGLAGYPISIVSGLDDRFLAPQSNLLLAREILASGGALLSEHPQDTHARPHFFPSRNRIMAGLSDAVLVIEAGERSGTLITARLAAEYNRELLCVPHRIGDTNAEGGHQFIRLGAQLVSEPLHILEALRI